MLRIMIKAVPRGTQIELSCLMLVYNNIIAVA